MAKQWFGRPFVTLAANEISQKFSLNADVSLIAIRCMFLYKDLPTTGLVGLRAKIYSDRAGSPITLLATSTNSWSASQITTLAHGRKEIYFTFNPFHLDGDNNYHVTLSATTYTGTDASHLAWALDYGDPTHTVVGGRSTHNVVNLGTWPNHVTFIGANL
jgi:hypothetical protein